MATKKTNTKSHFLLGAAFGAIAGAVAGILTAPKSGAATRSDIEKKGKQMLKDAKGTANTTKKAAKSAVSAAKKEFTKKK